MTNTTARSLPAPSGHIVVPPGLRLSWGSPLDCGTVANETNARLCFHPGEGGGTMVLQRGSQACACASASDPFRVHIELSAEVAHALLAEDHSAGARALLAFAGGGGTASFAHALTARAKLAVESIQRCPFAGVCRTMALTARCHDLLVEFLTAWSEALRPAPVTAPGPAEGARLAAEYLERDLENPPTLSALAAQVGLSTTTLKRAFPQVFDTTVFGYVRRRRMEIARRLLESGDATVVEAAARVGYSNPSNFAAAFRREFGVNPKTHQLASRR